MDETADERQIRELHEAGDQALMSADLETLSRIFGDDYVQHDESGKAFTKQKCSTISGRARFAIPQLFRLAEQFACLATWR